MTPQITNQQLMAKLEETVPRAELLGRLTSSVETLTRTQETIERLLRKQGENLAVVRSKVQNGVFVRREDLAGEIGVAVQQHVAACDGARIKEAFEQHKEEGKVTRRDRLLSLGLLLRSASTAASVVGGFAAASALGLI